jgi:hypothetical protein
LYTSEKQKRPITFLPGNAAFFILITHGSSFLSDIHF